MPGNAIAAMMSSAVSSGSSQFFELDGVCSATGTAPGSAPSVAPGVA